MTGTLRMLVADDDVICRAFMPKMLLPYGDCDVASNGCEAVDAFRRSLKDNNPYDLIFLDIKMPKMDGNDALVAIRDLEPASNDSLLNRVKIVMITAKNEFKSVLSSFDNGCEAYIMKPVMIERVDEVIKSLGLLTASRE